ncbi:MAG: serine hydrolase domain-containing protein [Pseudomonadota bacterium]
MIFNHHTSISFQLIRLVVVGAFFIATLSGTKTTASESYFEQRWSVVSPEQRLPIDPKHLEAYVDGAADKALLDHKISGLAISIVRSDGPVLVKGYGWSNAPEKLAVNADAHAFHIGSVSKVITATATMQLVQKGLIDLDKEVSAYLHPSTYDDRLGAITVLDLLGHTAGFEERYANFTGKVAGAEKLSDQSLLAKFKPSQMRAPGGMASYTNHTWVLLGKIIEAVTGVKYEDYVENYILGPLEMKHSGFEPEDLEEEKRFRRIKTHKWSSQGFKTIELGVQPQHPLLYPTGGMRASAGDMGRFAQMFLNNGVLDGERILQPQAFERSVTHTSKQALETNGRTPIFWTYFIGKHRVFQHTGRASGFVSRLIIIPSLDLAIFANANSVHGASMGVPLQITKHLLQGGARHLSPRSSDPLDLRRYAGTYKLSRGSGRFEKVYLTSFASVTGTGDNQLLLKVNGKSDLFYPVDVDLFQSSATGEYARFFGPQNGKANVFSKGGLYISFAERVGFVQTRQFFVLIISLGAIVSTVLLLSAVFGLILKTCGKTFCVGGRTSFVMTAAAIAYLVSCATVLIGLIAYGSDLKLLYGLFPTPVLGFGFVLAHIAFFLVFCAVVVVAEDWRQGRGSLIKRVYYTTAALALVSASLVALQWNIVPDSLLGIGL